MSSAGIKHFEFLQSHNSMGISIDVKIRNNFIEIKYRNFWNLIFIANHWWLRLLKISGYKRSNGDIFHDTLLVYVLKSLSWQEIGIGFGRRRTCFCLPFIIIIIIIIIIIFFFFFLFSFSLCLSLSLSLSLSK